MQVGEEHEREEGYKGEIAVVLQAAEPIVMKVSAFLWFGPKNLAVKKAPAMPPMMMTMPRIAAVLYNERSKEVQIRQDSSKDR